MSAAPTLASAESPGIAAISVALLEPSLLLCEALAIALKGAEIEVTGCFSQPTAFVDGLGSKPRVAVVEVFLDEDREDPSQGLTLLDQIHSLSPHTAVIALSPVADQAFLDTVRRAGADAVLDVRSTAASDLVAVIRAVARGEHLFQPAPPPAQTAFPRLSLREHEVLAFIAGGADNLKIAACLEITVRTVKAHVSRIYSKLGMENRIQLALLARQRGVRPRMGA